MRIEMSSEADGPSPSVGFFMFSPRNVSTRFGDGYAFDVMF